MDQFAPGYVGNISLSYDTTGRAAHLTLKIVLLGVTETTVYAPNGAGIEETEAGVYDIEQFTYPSVQGRYRSYWYDDGVFIPDAFDEFEITSTPLTPGIPGDGDLCTLADVEVVLEESISSAYATRVQAEITAASGELMRRLERELTPQSSGVTRRFEVPINQWADPYRPPLINLAPYDLRIASVVVVNPDGAPVTLTTSAYRLMPVPAADSAYQWIELSPYLSVASSASLAFSGVQVDVTGDWGVWSDPPMWARMAVAQWVRARTRISAAPTTYTENPSLGTVASPPVPLYDIPAAVWNAFKHLERAMG